MPGLLKQRTPEQKATSQPPVFSRNTFVERGLETGGLPLRPPVDLLSTSLRPPFATHPDAIRFSTSDGRCDGRSTGGQTGGVTGGLRNVKSFVHRHFGHPTGGVAIFMQNVYKNPLHHPLYGLPGRNGTLGRTKPMT